MRVFTLFTLVLFTITAFGQTVSDFENFTLDSEQFLNNAGEDGGFSSGNIFLPNSYNPDWMTWADWAISNTTDTTTPGFMNDGSAASGSGVNGSVNYAVAYTQGGENILQLTGAAAGGGVEGFYINNNTYAHLSMRDGDAFAKKFGGETGDDPDFFLLTIRKYLDGERSVDSINFYLADFRFEDNSEDYIITDWIYVDLTALGNVDSLSFILSSSDNGVFGMNTPAYFCIDDFITTDMISSTQALNPEARVTIFPNPSSDYININWQESTSAKATLYHANGQIIKMATIRNGNNRIEMSSLPRGTYLLKLTDENGIYTELVVKE